LQIYVELAYKKCLNEKCESKIASELIYGGLPMSLVDPVIVLPGVTASYLWDEYPLPPQEIWTVLKKKYKRVALHPNNLKYEAFGPSRVQPGQIFEVAYEELIEELRHNLKPKDEYIVPVYPFSYDWRINLQDIQLKLDEFIQEVINRTKILKHYNSENYAKNPKVNLIGHSMGGLIIAGYLKMKGEEAPVNKVITLATPFQGSFETIVKVTTGNANFGTSPPSSREREAARITPSLYHLIPSFKSGIEYPESLPKSLFNPDVWQPSILRSIEQWIKLNGLPTKNRKKFALKLFTDLLQQADKHRQSIDKLKLEDVGLKPKKWLAIVGVNSKTRVHLKIIKNGRHPEFYFDAKTDLINKWESSDPKEQRLTGDGTVPFEGAVPKFLDINNLVCVTPDDYEFWELVDKGLIKVAGFHGILPNMNMLNRLIVRFLKDVPNKYKNTWGTPAPGVDSKTEWDPPLSLKMRDEL